MRLILKLRSFLVYRSSRAPLTMQELLFLQTSERLSSFARDQVPVLLLRQDRDYLFKSQICCSKASDSIMSMPDTSCFVANIFILYTTASCVVIMESAV